MTAANTETGAPTGGALVRSTLVRDRSATVAPTVTPTVTPTVAPTVTPGVSPDRNACVATIRVVISGADRESNDAARDTEPMADLSPAQPARTQVQKNHLAATGLPGQATCDRTIPPGDSIDQGPGGPPLIPPVTRVVLILHRQVRKIQASSNANTGLGSAHLPTVDHHEGQGAQNCRAHQLELMLQLLLHRSSSLQVPHSVRRGS